LPDYDLTQFDHVGQTAAGNPDGPALAVRVAEVHDVVAQVSALLAGVSQAPVAVSAAVNEAMAELLGNSAVAFDLADQALVEQLIQGAALRLGRAVDPRP